MGRNVEIKARLSDPVEVRRRVESVADQGPSRLRQQDVYFHCRAGRLKLRKAASSPPELIQYQRPHEAGPKESAYRRIPCAPEVEEALADALGVRAIVRKTRDLFLVGRTRVHLDEVEDLGSFLELEVVLEAHEETRDGVLEAEDLLERLGVSASDLLEGSYGELVTSEETEDE